MIDIREPAEHATGVAAGARLLPMRQLGARLAEIPDKPTQPVLLICRSGKRARDAGIIFVASAGNDSAPYSTGRCAISASPSHPPSKKASAFSVGVRAWPLMPDSRTRSVPTCVTLARVMSATTSGVR